MEYLNIEYLRKGFYFLKKPLLGKNNEIDLEKNKIEFYRKSDGFKAAHNKYLEKGSFIV